MSALGFGGAAIGGLFEAVAERTALDTVTRALELGVTYLDTAPHYGLGISERRIGQALRSARLARDSYVLSTKVGRLLRPLRPGERAPSEGFATSEPLRRVFDFSRDGIRRSLEESLARLGLDRVDIVYLHDPDEHEDEVYATGYRALAELRSEGLVRAIGVGMNQSEMLARFVRRFDLDVVLIAGRYSLLDQGALDELLPACLERDVGVVVGGAFNSGLLADPDADAHFDYAEAPRELVDRARRIREVCTAHGVELPAAALQFPRAHPAVVSVVVGARSVQEIEENAHSFAAPIPSAMWAELQDTGLLDPGVPVP
ncbi:MAG: aldo/keto reductase [Solirubrobacterales bacterium]|nr:aldo/keto reductase [Solirubrobacterales bacterium]